MKNNFYYDCYMFCSLYLLVFSDIYIYKEKAYLWTEWTD